MIKEYVIYTAIFNNYDKLINFNIKNSKIDFLCFTDDKTLKSNFWNIIFIDENDDPKFINRKIKFLPHKYLKKYHMSLYIDGNIKLLSDPIKIFEKYSHKLISAPSHPERECIYDEAKFLTQNKKIYEKNIIKQITMLKDNKYPKNYGLNELNIILRKHNDESVIEAMNQVWNFFRKFPTRDQLIFNFVMWKNNLAVETIVENSRLKNKFFMAVPHNKNYSILRKLFNIFWYRRYHNKIFEFIAKFILKIFMIFK